MAAATSSRNLPTVVSESNLTRYLQEIRKFPMLEPQEEYMLAKGWREHGEVESAHKLVTSHLRLVAKIAMGYRGYGLPLNELISEGNVGMMQAVKRFEPERGFRLATYAMWWIRAAIQEYILHSWSLVKMGTTAAQKKLFFNLRKLKGQLQAMEEGDLSPENLKKIATELDASGKPGAVHMLATFDAWYPGYIDYMPMYQNVAAWWTETFSGGSCATPDRTRAATDLGIVLTHELAHVLMDSGEHSEAPGNLMHEDTAPANTKLSEAQCARLRDTGSTNGLLRPN